MILQHLVFPLHKNCEEEELYFRRDNKSEFKPAGNILSFDKGATISFDTYFNAISIGKWLEYTEVVQIDLCLKMRGKFTLSLFNHQSMFTETVSVTNWDTKGAIKEIRVSLDCSKWARISAFELTALEEGGEMFEGAYVSDVMPINKVKLALIICTFRREQYVSNNINILKEAFFDNESSVVRDKIKVYLSDNGNSLTIDETDSIKILPNKNTGGAGGFTRGMMEVWLEKETSGVTHALLMDDDVIIQPESIYRTYALWSLLKTKYQNSFVGGAMLCREEPWLQIEAGAYWNGGEIQSRKAKVDLREVKSCVQNEREESCDYNAWWYCSFSLSHIREDNLPIPLFIRGDDVEFGLRNMEHLILLNGICIWHQSFEHRYSSSLCYYVHRNRLIINAIHQISCSQKEFWREFCAKVIQELFVFRYKNVDLMLAGVEDFLRGIEWLKGQDGEILHGSILERSYTLSDLTDLEESFDFSEYKEGVNTGEGKMDKILRKLVLNGMLLKGKGDVIVPVINPHAYYLYRKDKALHYERVSKKGFVVVRDRKEFFRLLRRLLNLKRRFRKEYKYIAREYHLRGQELMNFTFWREYLNIKAGISSINK